MVKPQLNLEKKDDLKKPDGSLVQVITIQEQPAPIKTEPVYLPTKHGCRAGKPGCRAGKVLCMLLCTLLFIVLTFMLVKFFFHPYRGFRCGVGYYDDYLGQDSDYNSWYESVPFGDDMLIAPRPTGAPLLRYLEEGVDINLELRFIRINTPNNDDLPGVSVIHDFDLNLSAYKVPSSDVCYIRPLNFDSTLTPEDFQDLLENEAYKNQEFPMSSEVYTVDPNEVVTGVGDHIEEMCAEYTSYYIHSVPSDQYPAFWRTAHEVVRDHVRSTFPEFGERRHGEGGRHHDESSSEDRDGRGDDRRSHSSSSSEDNDETRVPRIRQIVRSHIDNLRSFDGQQVVDIHVFQTQNLDGLSNENLEKLMAFKDEAIMP